MVTQNCCAGELIEKIVDDLASFQEHVRIKRVQEAAFERDKSSARLIQIDFAMAYQCEYQNEVQSALWSRQSVNLLTVAVFYKGETKSIVICSDTKEKDKNAIFAFLLHVFDNCIDNIEDESIQEIIYSDGPSSEFKNKFMVKFVHIISQKYKKDFQWKYFATSHGKGVVDGIGGRIKSIVRQAVMSKRAESVIVQNSRDFARVASEKMTTTTVIHISQEEIDSVSQQAWDDVKTVPGIQKMHVVHCCLKVCSNCNII